MVDEQASEIFVIAWGIIPMSTPSFSFSGRTPLNESTAGIITGLRPRAAGGGRAKPLPAKGEQL